MDFIGEFFLKRGTFLSHYFPDRGNARNFRFMILDFANLFCFFVLGTKHSQFGILANDIQN